MLASAQLDQLSQLHSDQYLVTSCYLNLHRGSRPVQVLKIRCKDLLQSAHAELAQKTGSHAQRESLRQDFEQIEDYVMNAIASQRQRAVAIFSCAGEKFWQTHELPRVSRNILIADLNPYLRPLTAVLAEQNRFCTVVVDRTQGKVFDIQLGRIEQLKTIAGSVPRRVREGGLGGREERQIERHHSRAVQQHYQHLADEVFQIFKQHHFDRLVLGGHREVLLEFKRHLHAYLLERWAGDFVVDPSKVTPAEVLACTLEAEQHDEYCAEQRLATELWEKSEARDLAVRGVSDTVDAISRGAAQTLLVDHGFEMPGYACFQCHYPTLEPRDCPTCKQPTQPCADIVDEVIELARQRSCEVEHIHSETPLREGGGIGALLRYRT